MIGCFLLCTWFPLRNTLATYRLFKDCVEVYFGHAKNLEGKGLVVMWLV